MGGRNPFSVQRRLQIALNQARMDSFGDHNQEYSKKNYEIFHEPENMLQKRKVSVKNI